MRVESLTLSVCPATIYVNSWITLGLILDYSWIMRAVQQSFLPTAHGDAVQMASHPIDRLISKTGSDPQMPDSINVAWIPLGLLLDFVYGPALGILRARWRPRCWKRCCEAAELWRRGATHRAAEPRSHGAAKQQSRGAAEPQSCRATKPKSRAAGEATVADVDIARRPIYQTTSCEVRTNALQQRAVLV